jgi:hypothetical protein
MAPASRQSRTIRDRAAAAAGAALMWGQASAIAWGQAGAGDTYTGAIEAICRQYASSQVGMPAASMFEQCMAERHCRRFAGSGYECEPPGPMSWHGGGY